MGWGNRAVGCLDSEVKEKKNLRRRSGDISVGSFHSADGTIDSGKISAILRHHRLRST